MRFGKFLGSVKVGVGGAVLAVALAGCSEPTPTGKLPDPPTTAPSSAAESSAARPSTSAAPTTSAASTTTYTSEEQAVIEQYQGYYNAFFSIASLDSESVRQSFGPYATPATIDDLVVALSEKYVAAGKRPAGTVTFGPITVSIDGDLATVVECRDTSTELIVSSVDGSIISRGAPGTKVDAELRFESQQWLVSYAHGQASAC